MGNKNKQSQPSNIASFPVLFIDMSQYSKHRASIFSSVSIQQKLECLSFCQGPIIKNNISKKKSQRLKDIINFLQDIDVYYDWQKLILNQMTNHLKRYSTQKKSDFPKLENQRDELIKAKESSIFFGENKQIWLQQNQNISEILIKEPSQLNRMDSQQTLENILPLELSRNHFRSSFINSENLLFLSVPNVNDNPNIQTDSTKRNYQKYLLKIEKKFSSSAYLFNKINTVFCNNYSNSLKNFKFESVLNGIINNRHLHAIIQEFKFYIIILHNIIVYLTKFYQLTQSNDTYNKSFIYNYILGIVFTHNIGNEMIGLVDNLLSQQKDKLKEKIQSMKTHEVLKELQIIEIFNKYVNKTYVSVENNINNTTQSSTMSEDIKNKQDLEWDRIILVNLNNIAKKFQKIQQVNSPFYKAYVLDHVIQAVINILIVGYKLKISMEDLSKILAYLIYRSEYVNVQRDCYLMNQLLHKEFLNHSVQGQYILLLETSCETLMNLN